MSSDLSSIQSQFNLNSVKPNSEVVYEFEDFRLDAAHLMLYRAEKSVNLAPKVVETLLAIVERGGEIVSKEELMSRLWKNSFVEESNLTQNIYLLRKTLGKGADGRDLIETFRRRGYRFTGVVKSPVGNPAARDATEPPPQTASGERIEQPNAFDSLAVLPFRNESSDETAEYLSDGVTESIINRLSQLEDFRVVARNTAFRYKNTEIDQQKIGRDLSVSAVLTGRILQFGEKLIVRTELTDTASGWQIWGAQYDRRFADVLELQETIAREISEKLELKLSGEEKRLLSKRDTKSSEAYDFYVKGRYFLNKRLTEKIERATVFFQKAIDLDPSYALAYVGLADCYPLLSLYGKLTPREAYPKAETAARKALEIDDKLAEAYNSLGVVKLFFEWDWAGAEDAFQKAIALNPNYADAHQRYGMFLTAQERFDEASAEFEKAIRLDPLSLIIKTISGYPFYYAHRFTEAAARFGAVIKSDENYSMAHFRLGLTLTQLGEFDRAIAEFEKSIALSNDRDSIAAFAYAQGLAGNREKAAAALAELDEREKKGFVTSYNRALVNLGLGNEESSLDWLEKAFAERSYWLIYLKCDPSLDALRGHARFAALEEKIFGAADAHFEAPPKQFETPKIASAKKSFFSRYRYYAAVALGLLLLAGLIYGVYKFFDSRQAKASGANIRVTPLTSSPAPERNPALSPDGRQLAYVWVGEKDANFNIYVKITDAGTPLRLTDNPAREMSPAWSPDARFIAFLRGTGENRGFYIVPALGGPELKIGDAFGWGGLGVMPQVVDWSPDGKTLAVVDKLSEGEPWSIFLISVETGEKRKITTPPAQTNGDMLVAFAPDGKQLAFARTNAMAGNIFLVPVTGGEPTQLTFDKRTTLYGLDWTSDGKDLVFAAGNGGRSTLWTIPVNGGERASVPGGGENIGELSVSVQNNLLVYAQSSQDINIWRMEIADRARNRQQGALPEKLFSSTRIEDNPQFSPDGQKIAFKSNRSGNDEIWTCDSEGQNPVQLTNMGGASANNPRWSPDGQFITFEVRGDGNADVYVVSAGGGSPRRLTTDESEDAVPNWSRDGRFIYFASNRTGLPEVWKMPATGGEAVQVTLAGGFASSESPDGKTLYYSKGRDETTTLWKTSVEAAEDLPVIEQKIKQSWAVSQRGIYFVTLEGGSGVQYQYAFQFYDFATRQMTRLATLDRENPALLVSSLTVSPDERWLVYGQRDHLDYDLMLVENFR